jgi:hypothetical protein
MNEEIQCLIYNSQNEKIMSLIQDINSQEKLRDKDVSARILDENVEILLNCKKYNENEYDCINCHTISVLRKRTAGLITKTSLALG